MFQLDRDIQGYVLLFSGLGGRNWPADICSGILSIEEARERAGLVSEVTRRVRGMFYLRRDILDLVAYCLGCCQCRVRAWLFV